MKTTNTKAPAVWISSSMERLLPTALPPESATGPGGTLAVPLEAARGESVSCQIMIRTAPEQSLTDVRIETGKLIHRDRRACIDKSALEWQQVGFVRVRKTLHPRNDKARILPAGWHPDPLLEVERFTIPDNFSQPLWFTVHVAADIPAGDYAGTAILHMAGLESVRLQINLAVRAVTVAPGAGHLRTSFDLLDGFLENVYGRPVPPAIMRAYGEFLLRHRLNPDSFSRSDPPDIGDLRHYRRLGMNSFCAINLAAHRGNTIRGGLNSPPQWYTEKNWHETHRRVSPFLDILRADPDLWSCAYVHGFDERDIETHGNAMRLFFGNARRQWRLPTLTTSHVPTDASALRELQIDWLCPILAQYHLAYDRDKAELVRAAGFKVWSYISMDPSPPYPNWRLDSPLLEARTLWWQVFQQQMDGFLYWGVNIWDREHNDRVIRPETDGPFLDFSITTGGSNDWLHGDGVLLYPGANGPVGSIRLANIRDGLQDYDLLRQLGQADSKAAEQVCAPVGKALDQFTDNPAVIMKQRRRMLEALTAAPFKVDRECAKSTF